MIFLQFYTVLLPDSNGFRTLQSHFGRDGKFSGLDDGKQDNQLDNAQHLYCWRTPSRRLIPTKYDNPQAFYANLFTFNTKRVGFPSVQVTWYRTGNMRWLHSVPHELPYLFRR